MNGVNIGKLPMLAILGILFKNYLNGAKIWWLFVQKHENPTDCLVLEILTVNRFQNRICNPSK